MYRAGCYTSAAGNRIICTGPGIQDQPDGVILARAFHYAPDDRKHTAHIAVVEYHEMGD